MSRRHDHALAVLRGDAAAAGRACAARGAALCAIARVNCEWVHTNAYLDLTAAASSVCEESRTAPRSARPSRASLASRSIRPPRPPGYGFRPGRHVCPQGPISHRASTSYHTHSRCPCAAQFPREQALPRTKMRYAPTERMPQCCAHSQQEEVMTTEMEIIHSDGELTSEEIDLVDGGCLPEAIFKAITHGTLAAMLRPLTTGDDYRNANHPV